MLETLEEQQGFQFLLDKIRRNRGVDFSLYRLGTLKRRILARLRLTGCSDYFDYMMLLNQEPKEYDQLLDAITIKVTRFFRDPETFRKLQTQVIPEILKRKRGRQSIVRAWSVGTAYGEEAYSLAILLLEASKAEGLQVDVNVFGTDLDPAGIEQAKAGIYGLSQMKEVPRIMIQNYFHEKGNCFEIGKELKQTVRFRQHNLLTDPLLHHMDLILCRNVLIYFTKTLQEAAFAIFAKALSESGFLVLGKVESLWGYAAQSFETVDLRERIYRKAGSS